MRNILVAALLLTSTAAPVSTVWAAETIVASINGMVCAMCVVGIEKSFQKVPAVDKVKVDLEKKIVTVRTKDGAVLDDALVTKTIVNAGYAVQGAIKRSN